MMVEGVRNEISHGGASSPGSRYKRPNREACLVVGEVGGARSSDEAANPRGAKGPHLVEVSSETQDCAMASLGKIATTRKLQAFQRTLCRIAKRPTSTVHAVNDLGELDAGNPPVQFDEGWGVPGRTDNYGRLIFIRELPAYSTQLPDPTSPSVSANPRQLSMSSNNPRFFPVQTAGGVPLPFSEAVQLGDVLYVSGQIGILPGTLTLAAGGIVPESRRALDNMREVLERHGSSLRSVLKCTIFLADIGEWKTFNEVYGEYFPTTLPARSALAASGLALGARVELECIAYVPSNT